MDLYEKIKLLCKQNGFEISRIGEKIPGTNVTKGSISRWKKGAVPRASTLRAIAEYFDKPVSYFTEDNAVTAHNIQDNHGIIGHANAPVTIVNGSERILSEQEAALLEIFNELDVIKQAQLLSFAAELGGIRKPSS